MKDKKLIIMIVSIILVIAIIFGITRIHKKNQTKTAFENGRATTEVIVEKIEFTNITKEFHDGVTTIRAEVYNRSKKEKSINVKIIVKDKEGKELANMIQAIDKMEPEEKKILQTGITGDYRNMDNIEFKVLQDSEINQYNH